MATHSSISCTNLLLEEPVSHSHGYEELDAAGMHAKYWWSKWGQTQGLLPPGHTTVCMQMREFAQTQASKAIYLCGHGYHPLAHSSPEESQSGPEAVCDKGFAVQGLSCPPLF